MVFFWDVRADAVTDRDNLREVRPIREQHDVLGMTVYVFTKIIFNNPRYIIPKDHFTLFYNFLNGGSREYPSDGAIPVDVVAEEVRLIFKRMHQIANDSRHKFYSTAKKLISLGELNLLRGTMKLYMGEYTTRDWRRKRSTDDIDFWISDNSFLEFILTDDPSWHKNKQTREWEKQVKWTDLRTGRLNSSHLIASNDTIQGLDFGSGTYLDGSSLKAIMKKKIVRGHDVDLSDIINVAILDNIPYDTEPECPWISFEEAANMRHRRVTSNLISLSRYSHGIADYLQRVGEAIAIYKDIVRDQQKFSNPDIMHICRISSHWLLKDAPKDPDTTRERIYNNLVKMKERKLVYAQTLREFAYRIFNLLNEKYEFAGIYFEIQE
ncbi:MAG: hypothetical protein EU536_03975 [Promethearchaeota archaeon]|nr:MAG: hypothetical protein EU536_03975 [Candidatus Lokiarchaeota archaeon]